MHAREAANFRRRASPIITRGTLVANTPLRIPSSPFIKIVQVPRGFDVADKRIAEQVHPGDLVITADIPLAADVIHRGGHGSP